MALLADIDDSYTKTGKGTLARLADKASYIPWIGGWVAAGLGVVSTVVETAQYLFRGQFGSAVTALAAGAAGTVANSVGGFSSAFVKSVPITWWFGNAASGLTTGASLGQHARAATEAVIGAATGALGMKPQVLKSYPAGIGSINVGQMQSGPGKFAAGVSQQRGENPDTAYARYMAGEGKVHVNELQSANGRGA